MTKITIFIIILSVCVSQINCVPKNDSLINKFDFTELCGDWYLKLQISTKPSDIITECVVVKVEKLNKPEIKTPVGVKIHDRKYNIFSVSDTDDGDTRFYSYYDREISFCPNVLRFHNDTLVVHDIIDEPRYRIYSRYPDSFLGQLEKYIEIARRQNYYIERLDDLNCKIGDKSAKELEEDTSFVFDFYSLWQILFPF